MCIKKYALCQQSNYCFLHCYSQQRHMHKPQHQNKMIKQNNPWVTYYLHPTINRNGEEDSIKWMGTVVHIKDKEDWQIDVLHSNRLTKN